MDFYYCAEPWLANYPCDDCETSPTELAAVTASASQILASLTGHQFGLCTITLRPCRMSCATMSPGWYQFGSSPYGTSRSWYWTLSECAVCTVGCSCNSLSQVQLPWPVHDIVNVTLDGTVMATGAYRVDDNKWLVRLDGGVWPACNNLRLDDTEVGTWSVTARYGQDPPQLAKDAVGELACEFLKAYAGQDCRVPSNVVELVRQGVKIKYADVNGAFENGRTGLYLVDAFIQSVNPWGLRRRGRAFDVDAVNHRRAGT